MKAIVCTGYGGPEVLQETERAVPEYGKNDLLIRIKATSVNSGDCRVRRADPAAVKLFFGFTKPRKDILGTVFSGVVEQCGSAVTKFRVGDEVFGMSELNFGTFAEYFAISEDMAVTHKPRSISHAEAASIPFGATTALHFIEKANIMSGDKVLIYGASGSVGIAVVQIAKNLGAHVTAVCSTEKIPLLVRLGADDVIDYTKEDFTENGEIYDVAFDIVNKLEYETIKSLVKPKGKIVLSAAIFKGMMIALKENIFGNKKVFVGMAEVNQKQMKVIAELVILGAIKPIIDRTYSFNDMQEAHGYVDAGRKAGSVVVLV